MSNIPGELKYATSHEWARLEDDGTVTIGISDHAQEALGDLVYVEVPEVGQTVAAAEACCVVESVKAASDVYAPIAGEVIANNADLEDQPELVNDAAYEGGWLFKLKPDNAADLNNLLDAAGYEASLED